MELTRRQCSIRPYGRRFLGSTRRANSAEAQAAQENKKEISEISFRFARH
jgi:hypothetical protein